ncbi:hypothetical protein AB6Q56_08775 [Dechloromonas sp. ARDL1]|uniref:hypothetical protein n=1 Tax=Dechloromonas sp. ARDL1 TaxID=3322121 RepID=UPI003DA73E1C
MSVDWATVNWGSVADWVSGLGSMSAGMVALYLARSSERIRLRGFCGVRTMVGGGVDPTDFFFLSVTNVGTRSTVINNVSMQVGRFRKKRHAVITVVKDRYSVGIPYAINDGQDAYWAIPLGDNNQWMRDLCDGFVLSPSDAKTLRIKVHTNHGQVLAIKPDPEFVEDLVKILAEIDHQAPTLSAG